MNKLPDRFKTRAWHKPTQGMFKVFSFCQGTDEDNPQIKLIVRDIQTFMRIATKEKIAFECSPWSFVDGVFYTNQKKINGYWATIVKVPLSDCELMQCTDTEDKDEVLLFEEDIFMEFNHAVLFTLKFDKDSLSYYGESICRGWDNYLFNDLHTDYSEEIEVIGNTHQSPEILEAEAKTNEIIDNTHQNLELLEVNK